MSIAAVTALATSPVLKSALNVLLPIVHEVLGGGAVADKIVGRIQLKALDIDGKRIAAQQQVLKAELEGNYLQRTWRPITMLTFAGIIFFQAVLVPISNAIWGTGTVIVDKEITLKILDIMLYAIGGYIGARSVEKVAKNYIETNAARTVVTAKDDGLKPEPVPTGAKMEEPPFMKRD